MLERHEVRVARTRPITGELAATYGIERGVAIDLENEVVVITAGLPGDPRVAIGDEYVYVRDDERAWHLLRDGAEVDTLYEYFPD